MRVKGHTRRLPSGRRIKVKGYNRVKTRRRGGSVGGAKRRRRRRRSRR